MKRSELVFSAILVPLDFLMLLAAASFAYYLRFTAITDIRPVLYELPFGSFFKLALVVSVVWLGVFALSGLYAIRSTRRAVDEIAKIFFACSTGVLLIIVLVFFSRELFSSRFIILSGWIFSFLFVSIGRLVVRGIQHLFFRRGIGVHQVVVVGKDQTTDDLIRQIAQRPDFGLKIVHRLADGNEAAIADLTEKLALMKVDEIIQADPAIARPETQRLLDFATEHHIVFKYAADLFDTQVSNIDINTVAGIPLIEIKRTPLDGWGKILKRAFDLLVASICLIILSPLFLIVAIAVRLDSEGPAIVKLARIGEKGKAFNLFKFRSMVKNAQELKQNLLNLNERNDGPLFKIRNDPRITRVGRFIRKTSLDEIPQFWNVIRGQMSLVGPRPHEPEEVARYEKHHKKLLAVKPGISGMAQISGRSDLTFEEEVRLDTYYIENWTLRLDLQILLKTPFVVLSAKSAV